MHANRTGPQERPNILLIHADQLRFDCLGCEGNPDVRTPNIDALAADSVRYTTSWCPYPVCTPSRYSLLSGQYVHEHCGITNHSTPRPGTPFFPAILREAGYRTAAVGKMHFTPTYLDVGFSRMELSEQHGVGRWDDDYHRYLRDIDLIDLNDMEDQVQEYRDRARPAYWETRGCLPSNLDEAHYPTTWIADRAIGHMNGWQAGGGLLMVGFIKPHHPCDPPAPWHTMYDPQAIGMLPGWTEECLPHDNTCHRGFFENATYTEPQVRLANAYYYGLVSLVDHHVGRLISLLKSKGLYDNTLIVFTSDHGDYRGHHHMVGKLGYPYETLMRVPLFIKYPGGANGGTRNDALVNNIDVAPTLLNQAGCAVPPEMRGCDLTAAGSGHEILFGEFSSRRLLAARDRRWKLIKSRSDLPSLLFDLEQDPWELNNLFERPEHRAVSDRLSAAIDGWHDPAAVNYLDEDAPVIRRSNVPDRYNDHRKTIETWYRECWEEQAGEAGRVTRTE